jgi:hypothetical protein
MERIFIILLICLFLFPANSFASSFQYIDKIQLGANLRDPGAYGNNLLFIQNSFPDNDNIVVMDLNGIIVNSFVAKGAFTAGVTFNAKRNRIIFSGDNNYTGNIYEIDPFGTISDPVARAGYIQPYLAYNGSSILASGAASGSNGILTVPINKIDAVTYDDLGTIFVTVNTGTTSSGVGRSIITSDNTYLYVALGIGGLQDVYEFDVNSNLVQTIKITQITTGQGIGGLIIINNDLYVFNSSTNELYHYLRLPAIGVSGAGGGGGGGCSVASSRGSTDYSATGSIVLLLLPMIILRIRRVSGCEQGASQGTVRADAERQWGLQ